MTSPVFKATTTLMSLLRAFIGRKPSSSSRLPESATRAFMTPAWSGWRCARIPSGFARAAALAATCV